MAEFDPYLRCGRLVHGFIGAKCTVCRHEHLVAFSAIAPALLYLRVHAVELFKRHGWCSSCVSPRMAESGAHRDGDVYLAQARDPIAQARLSLNGDGLVVVELKRVHP